MNAVFSTLSCGEQEDVLQFFAYSHVDCSVPLNNAFFFIDAFINNTLGYNANPGRCTGLPQCLLNSSKHSSGWYSTVRKISQIFRYGMN